MAASGCLRYSDSDEHIAIFDLTVLRRTCRFLLLWIFIALQAMVPFIHAHAGAANLNHTGFLHLHQDVAHADATWHVLEADEHGTEVAVAAGLPGRNGAHTVPADVPPAAAPLAPWPAAEMQYPGTGLSAPPAVHRVQPGYTLPPAFAPPVA